MNARKAFIGGLDLNYPPIQEKLTLPSSKAKTNSVSYLKMSRECSYETPSDPPSVLFLADSRERNLDVDLRDLLGNSYTLRYYPFSFSFVFPPSLLLLSPLSLSLPPSLAVFVKNSQRPGWRDHSLYDLINNLIL